MALLLALGLASAQARTPQLFFTPQDADVGDPNPFFHDGLFYVYYLWSGGFHPWALTTTPDALRFSPSEEVLSPGPTDAQDVWIGSGSVVQDEEGLFHLFYTGHNPDPLHAAQGKPREAVMRATSRDLKTWTKRPEGTFSASGGYFTGDFRDPLVFYNEDEGRYWLLITTRREEKAVVGLYTSADLKTWTPEAPIYEEASELNLEVPDLFKLGERWYLVFSDQRSASRQVRYLYADSPRGPWQRPAHDALDGKAYYAARTASDGKTRYLFGWAAHKELRKDSMPLQWGGHLLVHEVVARADGTLGVRLPRAQRAYLSAPLPLAEAERTGRTTLSGASLSLEGAAEFLTTANAAPLRLTTTVRFAGTGEFGLFLREPGEDSAARLRLTPASNTVTFALRDYATADDPWVALPLEPGEPLELELVLSDSVGVLYINSDKALTFRYYGLPGKSIGFYTQGGAVTFTDTALFSRVP